MSSILSGFLDRFLSVDSDTTTKPKKGIPEDLRQTKRQTK